MAALAILPGREFAQLHVDSEVLTTAGDLHGHCLTGVLADERIRPRCCRRPGAEGEKDSGGCRDECERSPLHAAHSSRNYGGCRGPAAKITLPG